LFTLKIHRGEGMVLLAMNWKTNTLPLDFVGFSIEYSEPDGKKFYSLRNRLSFRDEKGRVSKYSISSLLAPFQKFRWIHFPRNADMDGDFTYQVKPVFMNDRDELSYGESQTASIQLKRETYPGKLNVTFTRGFVSSQAFVDKFEAEGGVRALLPPTADEGLDFFPTHPKADDALPWMGFEARSAILGLLDQAIDDTSASVKLVAYDLNLPELVDRLEQLGDRLMIIIDDSPVQHKPSDSAESRAEQRLLLTTNGKVKRHHMSQLQHNKFIVVNGDKVKAAICGSTNFSWRGFFVQANNALVITGADSLKPFLEAFADYWDYNSVKDFGKSPSALWNDLAISNIDAKVSFSPHAASNALLKEIAGDIENGTQSNLFYSLAFLYQTTGAIPDAVKKVTENEQIFVYGISDKKVGGLVLQKPSGNLAPVYPSEISKGFPEPFKSEPTGGTGNRMHHKFVVIDFDKPSARVYLGSYNFSPTADTKNGENLVLIRDRRVAVAYMIEALRLFDHYHFRVSVKESKSKKTVFCLSKPPREPGEEAWWIRYYADPRKILDRELFSK